MTQLTRHVGPEMNRDTVRNVQAAGFQLLEVNNLFMDVVKVIKAIKPTVEAGPSKMVSIDT